MERRIKEGKRVLMELDGKRKVCEGSLVGGMSAKGNRLSMPRLMRLLIRPWVLKSQSKGRRSGS
jgi:hypothetical protein